MVIALETPVTDQPVSREIGSRNTGSENMAPMATQPSRPPAATITQRSGSVHDRLPVDSRRRLPYKGTAPRNEAGWQAPASGFSPLAGALEDRISPAQAASRQMEWC